MKQEIYFNNSRSYEVPAIISISSDNKNAAFVIVVHGFGAHKNAPGNKELSDNLTLNGINNFRFDLPGHGQSEEKFEDLTVSHAADDVLSAITFLKNQGYTNLGLIGTSFGGMCSIVAASKSTDLSFLGLRSPVADYYVRELMAKTKLELDNWRLTGFRAYTNSDNYQVSLKYSFLEDAKTVNGFILAEKISIPTFIVHGDADSSVPILQSQMLVKCITNSELKIIEGADHLYSDKKLNQQAIDLLIKFISSFK